MIKQQPIEIHFAAPNESQEIKMWSIGVINSIVNLGNTKYMKERSLKIKKLDFSVVLYM